MSYYLDFNVLTLDFLSKRLGDEDLIPSLLPLREGIVGKFRRLGAAGIERLEDLSRFLAKDASLHTLVKTSGIDAGYLKLLGRALRGYRPKPAALADYPGVAKQAVARLARLEITDSRELWEAARRPRDRARLAEKAGIDKEVLLELAGLADLSRIQWVSPLFARLLYNAGFKTVHEVARAKPDEICNKVDTVNKVNKMYKGRIGTRDMGRLVYLASLLPRKLIA